MDVTNAGTITSEVIRTPDSYFYIPMQNFNVGGTTFYDTEVRTLSSGYSGLRSHLKYKYFEFEIEIKGESNANHQGVFWGNSNETNVEGGSSTGWRTCHQSGSNLSIRTCNGNSDVSTYNPPFNPNDNQYHHYKVQANKNGTLYVWVDGILAHSGSFVPASDRYIGLVNFAGHVWFKNMTLSGWNRE
jgi:hypothetical protein